MLQYPSILGSSKAPIGKPCIAFFKYDGSNLRWEWSPKKGWNKFGTRHQLFDASDPIYAPAIPLFLKSGLSDAIVERTKQINKNIERITAFTEYFGPNSFAGKHNVGDTMQLRLLDVFLFKKGFVPARQFVKLYGDLPEAAEVVYDGNLNQEFINDVRLGRYTEDYRRPGFEPEGVIAKGEDFMVKIKTHGYFRKLNEVYGTDYRNHWE